ncbi:MSHA biogenesis protein MshQ [Marinobacter sp. LV10R520-4]|uniref:DUF6701 domain-containing protein n=1 Tax=Marinobacter sp. LV10R520-4 TaxID=1761796 RepID=UPI000BF252FE|nr:DUF6701 domain-containing protein [Marinobacter sp. LV10R520-4]PFG52111.1 MSHA biogenesis protein MshQ [Marinobacter sp. LV10R520-4]
MKQQGSISRHAWLKTARWTLLLLGLLLGNLAQAATDYFFHPSSEDLPAGCKKDDGHSYSCGVLTLAEDDTITLGGLKPVTITFSGAFTTGASNLINASGAVDDLKLITNGALTLGANTRLNANVVGTAAVTLDEDVTVDGAISTGAGAVTVGSRSTVGGGISTGAGVVTLLASATLGGGITTEDGGITVGNQSSVGGAITSTGAGVVWLWEKVEVAGGVSTVTGGITVKDQSRVCGSISITGAGVVVLTTNIKVGGSVITQVGAITIGTGSTVGNDVISGGVITLTGLLTGLLVGGNVSSIGAGAITTTTTSIGGNVSSGAGVITLTNSQVRGTVTSDVAIVKTGGSVGDINLVINIPSACSAVVVGDIHHFEISAPASGLTCNPLDVTVKACLNETCDLYTDSITAQAQITQGVTTNSQTQTFTGGSQVYALRAGTFGEAFLSMASSTPAASAQTLCSIGSNALSSNCTLQMVESGFVLFDSQTGSSLIPNHIAGRTTLDDVWVRAVKSDPADPLRCIPGFSEKSERMVGFASDYINPAPTDLVGSPKLKVNDVEISNISSAFTLVPLDFNAQAEAPIRLFYPDAGKLSLSLRYEDKEADTGLVMTSTGNTFVVRPYGLCLYSDTTNSSCLLGDANCSVFVPAGDPFDLSVKAVAWEAGADTDFCSVKAVTPNYRQSGITLTSSLVAPDSGSSGILGETNVDIVFGDAGEKTHTNQTISEVGVFTITANPPNYLDGPAVGDSNGDGVIDKVSTSANIGRFIPAYLDVVGSASLTPSCGPFSYQGQPMGFAAGQAPRLQVSGHNRAGVVTTNYDRGDFWRLNAPERSQYTSVTGVASFDQGYVVGPPVVPARLQEVDITQSEYLDDLATEGNGIRIARWSDQQLWYLPAVTPTIDDRPFQALVSLNVSAAALTDEDGVCYTHGNKDSGAACADYFADADPLTVREPGFGGSEVRLGRLRIGNAHGSELQALNLPLTIETWQAKATGSAFVREGLDNCSAGVLGDPVLDGFSGQLAAGETTPSVVGPSAGVGQLGLTAPGAGKTGSVRVHFAGGPSPALPPTWLDFDWNGTGREAAQGIATFGIYSGPTPLIFRRELYR